MEKKFDPDGVGVRNGNYFGMPFTPDEAALVLVSVPWDVTSSYGGGAATAPEAMINESTQLDFYDPWAPGEWRKGIATLPVDMEIAEKSTLLRKYARDVMVALENGDSIDGNPDLVRGLEAVNAASKQLDDTVRGIASEWLGRGKLVGLVGGDHSTPLGLIGAVAGKESSFGILHLDAHCDLRPAYEGFESSHASIMYNVLRNVPQVERLVQVGVRDFSDEEIRYARAHPKITLFTGAELSEKEFEGESWAALCDRIVASLPEKVYVSFDIDFLSPEYCPGTGTPVPGGCSFDRAAFLLRKVADSGRRIVGFDLCEVASGTSDAAIRDVSGTETFDTAGAVIGNGWNANVGARMLFKLCGQALRTLSAADR